MNRTRWVPALALLVALAVGGPSEARTAEPATRAEAAALASEAATDDQALAELRAITTIDGEPVDLEAATAELGDQRAARLAALAVVLGGDPPRASTDVDEARERAEAVLDQGKFQRQRLPQPFKGPLEWLADRLRPVGDLIDTITGSIPGGRWLLLGGLGVAIGAIVWWAVARTGRARVVGEAWSLVDPAADPAALDREADEAEATGDHALAVRRRYESGLLRLAREGRIELRPDTTPASVAAALADPTVARLTTTFEEVVYGGRTAFEVDADAAREGWRSVLGARSRR